MALDPAIFGALGEALTKGLPAYNNATQLQLERQQQAAKESREQQLLALALSRGELEQRQAADARAHTQWEEEYQTNNAKRLNQQANLNMLSQYPGATLTAEQVKGLDLGPMQNLALSPVAPSEGVKIYTSPDAAPDSLQTVGAVAPGTMKVSPTFNDQVKQGLSDLKSQQIQLEWLAKDARTDAEAQHWRDMADVARERAAAAEATAAAKRTSLTPSQYLSAASRLNRDYMANTKAEQEIAMQHGRIQTAWQELQKNPGTLQAAQNTLIDSFQRIVNPNSIIRNTAYMRTLEGQSFMNKAEGILQKLTSGGEGLTPATLKSYVDVANQLVQPARASIARERERVLHQADRFGIDPADILQAEETAPTVPNAGSPPPGPGNASPAFKPGSDPGGLGNFLPKPR